MATVPMFAPTGEVGDVPKENVQAAVQKGFKLGQDMVAPDGVTHGTVPIDNVHAAIAKGFNLVGAAPAAPNPIGQASTQAQYDVQAAGPYTKPGAAEAGMGFGTPASETLSNAGQAVAKGANYAAPIMTGGASLPVQMAVQGAASGADTAVGGGSGKDIATSTAIGAAIPAVAEGAVAAGKAIAGSTSRLAANVRQTYPAAANLSDRAISGLEKIFSAAAPVGKNSGFRDNLYAAAGDLADISKKVALDEVRGGVINPDMRPAATVKAIDDHLSDMYKTIVEPQIATAPKAPVQIALSEDAANGLAHLVTGAGEANNRAAAATLQQTGKITLEDAYNLARSTNAELRTFERATAQGQSAAVATSKTTNGLKELDTALSQGIDQELEAQGKPGIKDFERRYAALSAIRDQIRDRVNSAELAHPGVLRTMTKNIGAALGGPKAVASASQAAVSDVRMGKTLEQGMNELRASGLSAPRPAPRMPAPFNLTPPPGQVPPPSQGTLPLTRNQ